MKNLKKKGFTIVELVIVIAVIAVLAAVLIPTFVNLTKKANMSSDQQAVRHMNTLLAMDETKPTNADEVVEILLENGYKDDLTTYYDGYILAWLATENKIVLVENNAVVWPKDYEGETVYTELKPMVKDVEELLESLTDGKTVFIAEDITSEGLFVESAGEYTVNLNGNKLTASDLVGSWVEGGKLVVSDGVIDASTSADNVAVYASVGGILELENVQIFTASAVNPIQCYGGTMTLKNVTASQTGSVVGTHTWYNSTIQIINTIKQVEGKWTIYGSQAEVIIDGGMYSGKKTIQISAPGGNVTINSGNFIGTEYVIQDDFAPQNYGNSADYESIITINGGNFEGAIKISAATKLIINGGTFTINPSTITNGEVTINGTVVDNGNGTWTIK